MGVDPWLTGLGGTLSGYSRPLQGQGVGSFPALWFLVVQSACGSTSAEPVGTGGSLHSATRFFFLGGGVSLAQTMNWGWRDGAGGQPARLCPCHCSRPTATPPVAFLLFPCPGGHHIFADSRFARAGEKGLLRSPGCSAREPACLRFWYRTAVAAEEDALKVYVALEGEARPLLVWLVSESSGGRWLQAEVDLHISGRFQVDGAELWLRGWGSGWDVPEGAADGWRRPSLA